MKDLTAFELTRGLADALTASLDDAYREYVTADSSGASTEEAERRIAAIPEGRRYLTRVLDSLDSHLRTSTLRPRCWICLTCRTADLKPSSVILSSAVPHSTIQNAT